MNANPINQRLLTQDQLKLHQAVIDYLVQVRRAEDIAIKQQAPTLIPKNCHIAVCLIMTLAITVLNFDQLFKKVQQPSEIALLTNYDDVQKKVEYVFEHTVMKYSILYPMKLRECQSYIPFIASDTLCSEKSIDVKAKLVYSIGFRPNYEKLSYSPQNNSISGEWGPLQILSMTENRQVQAQHNGLINDWSVLQFQEKYQKRIKQLEPQFKDKVNQYIENITSNQNSLQKLEKNIKNSLIKIITDGKGQKRSLSDRILSTINRGFDKLLIFLSIEPLQAPEQKIERDQFSPQYATQYYKEQIFMDKQQTDQAKTQVSETNKIVKPMETQKSEIQPKGQVQAYNSNQIRQKYNALLKKVK